VSDSVGDKETRASRREQANESKLTHLEEFGVRGQVVDALT
jgi:hypothetical protein